MKKVSIIIIGLILAVMCLATSCGKNKNFEYEKCSDGIKITKYIGTDKEIIIPDEINGEPVVIIGEKSFDGTGIESVTIPKSVKEIERYAFRRCGVLKSVTINADIKVLRTSTFNLCISLSEVKFPENLEKIEDNVFGQSGLESIVIPDSVREIGEYAFMNCGNLKSFDSGKGLEILGDYALCSCISLTDVKLNENIKTIGKYALSACSSLEDITLPNSLKSLSEGVLCATNISELYVPSSVETIEALAVSNCKLLKNIYIPESVTEMKTDIFVESKNFTIFGIKDSKAEIYADTYGYKFEVYDFN